MTSDPVRAGPPRKNFSPLTVGGVCPPPGYWANAGRARNSDARTVTRKTTRHRIFRSFIGDSLQSDDTLVPVNFNERNPTPGGFRSGFADFGHGSWGPDTPRPVPDVLFRPFVGPALLARFGARGRVGSSGDVRGSGGLELPAVPLDRLR